MDVENPENFVSHSTNPYETFHLFDGVYIKWSFDDMLIKCNHTDAILKIINEKQPDYFDKVDKYIIFRIYGLSSEVRVNIELLGKRTENIIDNMDISDIYNIMKYCKYYQNEKDEIILLLLKRNDFFKRINDEMYEVLKYEFSEPDDFDHHYNKQLSK